MSYKFPERTIEIRSYELALILSPESSDANKNLIKSGLEDLPRRGG